LIYDARTAGGGLQAHLHNDNRANCPVPTTSSTFDVVIAGAGPAGSSAAAVLATAGLRVALIDKARFPRDKLCGGLLSERSVRALRAVFGQDSDLPIEVTSTGAAVFDRDRPLVRVDAYKPLHFVSRRSLDAHLASLAARRGAQLIEECAVTAVDPVAHAVELADGRVLSASFVIGADGASSRIRKLVGVAIDRTGFAVGLETEVPREAAGRDVRDPEIYFGLVEWGYAWIFPKRATLTVGIGGLAAENGDMRSRFREFATTALGRVPAQAPCGSPIPFGNFVARPGHGSTLLAGDAAGLVEPLTGEGIAFAVQSGAYAAQAIVDAARAKAPSRALALYLPRYRSIIRSFRDVRVLRHLVFSRTTRGLFLRALNGNRRMVLKHMDVLAGNADYRDYARYALAETLRRVPRLCVAALR
jgi:geranylgeranyl reductase family protein